MNPETHSCDCGYTWRHGHNGTHLCGPQYRATIERQAQEIAALKAVQPSNMDAWIDMRHDVLTGIDGLDNDQVNIVLGIIDQYTPDSQPLIQEKDPIRELIKLHAKELDQNDYAYFELARTRRTDWMAWICTNLVDNDPDRKVLATGQGSTPEKACSNAIIDYATRAKDQPQ